MALLLLLLVPWLLDPCKSKLLLLPPSMPLLPPSMLLLPLLPLPL